MTVLAFPDYPSYCLGDALNGLSIDGRCSIVPSESNHSADWCWRFAAEFGPAAVRLAKYFEHEVYDDSSG